MVDLGQVNDVALLKRRRSLFQKVGVCRSSNYANKDHQYRQIRSSYSTIISDDKINFRHHPLAGLRAGVNYHRPSYLSIAKLDYSLGIEDRKRKAETVIEDIQALSQILDEPHRKQLHKNNTIFSISVTF